MYVHFTQCTKLLSKHLDAKFKNLLGMQFTTDIIFLVYLSIKNYLFIYVFTTGVGFETRYLGTTELTNIPCIRAKVTCTISVRVKETWILKLKICMLNFLEGNKYLTENDCSFHKEKTYFVAVNNQEEYFKRNENICCMVFLNNILMKS